MVEFLGSLGLEPRHLSLLTKWAIAVSATALLAQRAVALKRGPLPPTYARRADRTLAVLAMLAFVSWWHVEGVQFGTSFHRWEFFHYYLGAKYSAELEYTRLYDCTAAAEAEDDPSSKVLYRTTRNLRTNVLEQGSPAARNPEICRSRFTPARWQEFKHDALWFRAEARRNWARMQVDHGYNATPVWNAAGHLLANTGPASKRQMVALALIDPVLIATMWLVVWWAFGWRAMAVAVIFWGTNFPARYFYLGASFLRSDWLVMSVIGIALAKRGYMMLAGAALGWSTLLRVFPGFLASGAVLRFLQGPMRRGDSASGAVRLVAGACLALALLISFSFLSPRGSITDGVERWRGFVENSRKHLSGSSVNRVGLPMLAMYSPGNDYGSLSRYWLDHPGDAWQAVRNTTFEERRVLYWAIVAVFLALLALAVRGQPYWTALVLGVGLIPMVSDITCYYYGILLVYGLLSDRYPWIGVGLAGLSAFTLMASTLSPEEFRYTVISLGIVLYVFVVTAGVAWSTRASQPEEHVVSPAAA